MRLSARLGAVAAGLLVIGVWIAPAAAGQGGTSTPGVVVTATNPGTSGSHSSTVLSLTAHSGRSTVPDPSCRPQDLTLGCWASLVLRVPDEGGFSVTGFQVHRVAIGDIGCGDDGGGGCSDVEAVSSVADPDPPPQVQVNGVAFVADPGTVSVGTGTEVQLKMTLTDYGTAHYEDQIDVVVNRFEEGPTKPLLFDTGPQTIQRLAVHLLGNGA